MRSDRGSPGAIRERGPSSGRSLVVAVVVAIVAAVAIQTASNLRARGIASGFDYLGRAAGFEIAGGPIEFSSRDTYARALSVGLFNTLRVSLLGIVLATALGVASAWRASRRLGRVDDRERLRRGDAEHAAAAAAAVLVFAVAGAAGSARGAEPLAWRVSLLPRLVLAKPGWQAGYPWIAIERPVLVGFGFHGGTSVSPEFAALLDRPDDLHRGIHRRDRPRWHSRGRQGTDGGGGGARTVAQRRSLRLVVLPQALRVIIPPTTSQFLNLFKNSSLAVAIGYPDLISITNTTLNQTGQAIEAITLAMVVYLAISLTMSLAMNAYNRRDCSRRGGGRQRMTRDRLASRPIASGARRCSRDRTNAIATAGARASAHCATLGVLVRQSGRMVQRHLDAAARRGLRGVSRRAGRRARAGRSSPSAFASSCSAPIRTPSSGGRPWPACCSWRCTSRARYAPGGTGGCSALWIALAGRAVVLLRGGVFGLADVPSEFWGGLPLTFLLSTVGFAAAFPLAVALALGRRSRAAGSAR